MNNRISNKFTLPGLIRFSLPAIAMLVLSSLYTMVDGVFVSRFRLIILYMGWESCSEAEEVRS